MFARDFFEVVHIIGIAMIFVAIGGVSVHAANGGTKVTSGTRRLVGWIHSVGTVLILAGGFGMAVRLGLLHQFALPGWLWVKVIVWAILSAASLAPYRWPALARPCLVLVPFLAGVAVYMALYKPF
jgi:hypothetical protein